MTKILIDRSTVEQALEAMGSVGADWVCEASHHAKKDQHKWGDPCPLQQRWHVAYQALRAALAEPVQEPCTYKCETWPECECAKPWQSAPPQRPAESVQDPVAQQALNALLMMRDKYGDYACPACDHADAAIKALRGKK